MDLDAAANGYIVAYPRGLHVDLASGENLGLLDQVQRFWYVDPGPNGEVYNTHPSVENVDDVGFVSALLDDVESRFSVDPLRVFATGFSNGGVLGHFLACELSTRIAAIAPVSGPVWADPAACEPERPVSVLHFHGTADICAPYDGGGSECEGGAVGEGRIFMSAQDSIDMWREKNGCSTDSDPQSTIYGDDDEVNCQSFGPCSEGTDVVLCSIEGGDHAWPGGSPYYLPLEAGGHWFSTTDVSANELMWQFFVQHPMASP